MLEDVPASADCTRGRITAVDGQTYTLDGVWDDSDIGAGRTRWRDGAGAIVGRDNASGGLGISQQWEVLCPGPVKGAADGEREARGTEAGAGGRVRRGAGDRGEVRSRVGWRGRIDRIRQAPGGSQVEYDVRLDNGQRGVPAAADGAQGPVVRLWRAAVA